jgi:hypothetical protein
VGSRQKHYFLNVGMIGDERSSENDEYKMEFLTDELKDVEDGKLIKEYKRNYFYVGQS